MNQGEIVYENFYISDEEGKTPSIPLYAPDIALSLDEESDVRPYETYSVEMRASGFEVMEIQNVQVFAEESSYLPVHPIPTRRQVFEGRDISNIPDHHLLTNYGGNNQGQTPHNNGRILSQIVIPTFITVHLGRPQSNAENVTVPFLYYLKNVASSEIYPTWPYEALKANIWAQASLALNRVYTEWYPSQGYDFDITNSTAFDQAFVKDRNIYSSVAEIVDEVFNQYIQKRNYQEPYYAEYCDGKIADCPGMKQWGTLTLANQGYTALQILRYYYGADVYLATANRVSGIPASFPGYNISTGSRGADVRTIQRQLNAVSSHYPAIPKVSVDGIFGSATAASVRKFQEVFNLPVSGIVDSPTWYRLSQIYVAVTRIGELN